jgi:hypothetical protein
MAFQHVSYGSRRCHFDITERGTHRVRLVRPPHSLRCLRSILITPKLAADAGITTDTRVALFWEDEKLHLALKVMPFGGPGTHKPRRCGGDVLQIQWPDFPEEAVKLFFPADAEGEPILAQSDCTIQLVPKPDGNEVHILPPPPPAPEPDPDENEIAFGNE